MKIQLNIIFLQIALEDTSAGANSIWQYIGGGMARCDNMNLCNYNKNILLLYESRILPLSTSISEEYKIMKSGNDIRILHGTLEYYIPNRYIQCLEWPIEFLFNGIKVKIYWWRYRGW